MEMLVHDNYILQNPDRKELKEHGFRYNREMSESGEEFYSLRFPVLQYHKSTTVEGEIIIDMDSGNIRVNAYNYGTKSCYPPFYNTVCNEVYRVMIEKINKAFSDIFNEVGIRKVGDN